MRVGIGKYTLDEHTPVPCDNLMEWGKWMEKAGARIVARTMVGSVRVSTVFLGLDHSFDDGPPILFETMVFGGPMNQYQDRYRTWDEAEAGHRATVEQVEAVPCLSRLRWRVLAVCKELKESWGYLTHKKRARQPRRRREGK